MGLVQKIFYFHVPAAMTMFLAAFVCGIASVVYLWRRSAAADHLALAAAELAVVVRHDRPRHGPALGAQGLGRLVGLGAAPHDARS